MHADQPNNGVGSIILKCYLFTVKDAGWNSAVEVPVAMEEIC